MAQKMAAPVPPPLPLPDPCFPPLEPSLSFKPINTESLALGQAWRLQGMGVWGPNWNREAMGCHLEEDFRGRGFRGLPSAF